MLICYAKCRGFAAADDAVKSFGGITLWVVFPCMIKKNKKQPKN